MVRVGFHLPDELLDTTIEETVRWAQRAERAGFDSVWKGETTGTNGLVVLSAVAQGTERVDLGVGIASVFSRSPGLLAMSAATFDELSDGRFRLALGVSSEPIVENWHGIPYDRPLRRLRETFEILRTALGSESIDYDGDIFDVGPFSTGYVQTEREIPIYNSAAGPVNRQLTGEFADGWIPVFCPRSAFESECEEIRESASAAGRDPDSIVMAPWIPVGVDENDPEHAERLVRDHIAQELAMGYDAHFAAYGYGDVASDVAEIWLDGDRKRAAARLTDEIVDQFAVHGTPAEVRENLGAYVDAGADELVLWNSFTAGFEDVRALIEATAPNQYDL
jgi:alkanesulfonate monooxygenase SsuD/methylene tetrahydromethanopterin reductase-like flavin-dependent oxidoreductase (luciferase family)